MYNPVHLFSGTRTGNSSKNSSSLILLLLLLKINMLFMGFVSLPFGIMKIHGKRTNSTSPTIAKPLPINSNECTQCTQLNFHHWSSYTNTNSLLGVSIPERNKQINLRIFLYLSLNLKFKSLS